MFFFQLPKLVRRDYHQVRRVQKYRVFIFTCIVSILAYLWLFLILKGSSPCQVDIWEASLTLLYFPLMAIIAWRIDKHESKLMEARRIVIGSETMDASSEGSRTQFADHTVSFLKSESKFGTDKFNY